jgi:hypothetical protein
MLCQLTYFLLGCEKKKLDHKAIKVKLYNAYEAADLLDSKIIDILINLQVLYKPNPLKD